MSKAKALMLGFDGYERVIDVSDPPASTWFLPVYPHTKWTFDSREKAALQMPPHRVFRLRKDLRSLEHRWERLSESGRSCTLEPGYVYMEERS